MEWNLDWGRKECRFKEWIDYGIGESGAGMIGEALKCNSSLTELYVNCEWKKGRWREKISQYNKWEANGIGDEGVKIIAEALKCNCGLTELWLDGNKWKKENGWKRKERSGKRIDR